MCRGYETQDISLWLGVESLLQDYGEEEEEEEGKCSNPHAGLDIWDGGRGSVFQPSFRATNTKVWRVSVQALLQYCILEIRERVRG
jgi:hypothetical protein